MSPWGSVPPRHRLHQGAPLAGESDAVVVARERESHPTSPDETQGEALDRTSLLLTYLLLLKDQGHAWHSAPDKPVCQGVVVWPTAEEQAGEIYGRSSVIPNLEGAIQDPAQTRLAER